VKILFLTLAFIAQSLTVWSQSVTPSTPASPQAEAFQRLGDFVVNNASGMPDINIPLYTIDYYGYKIPVTLRYIATPLKPGYNYDVTGCGWALSLGSCISRTIASAPDENHDFKLSQQMLNGYFKDYGDRFNGYNYQYDEFRAVLPNGNAFQFYINKGSSGDYQYIVSTNKYYKITVHTTPTNISGFTVIDDSGVHYSFDIAESTIEPQNRGTNVAWYLSSITLPNIPSPITFRYNASIKQNRVPGLEEKILTLTNNNPVVSPNYVTLSISESDTYSYYRTKLLTSISAGDIDIGLQYQNGETESECNYLKRIKIYGLKDFRFDYSFSTLYPQNLKIAHLTRLVETGTNSSKDSLVYKFTYPSMGGFSGTDHWGNYTNDYYYRYNLANINFYMECLPMHVSNLTGTHMVTSLGTDPNGWCPYQKFKLVGYNTYSEPRQMLSPSHHMILSSITYPTGAKTVFDFENHRFVTCTDANGDYIETKRKRRVIEGGGFRIRSITNYTTDNKIASIRQFRYGPTFREVNERHLNLPVNPNNLSEQHVGYGEPVVDPNVLTYSHFTTSGNLTTSIQNMLLGKDSSGQRRNFASPFSSLLYNKDPWRFDLQFSPIFFRQLLKGRNAVVYSEITEYHGDVGYLDQPKEDTQGKTVYRYDIYHNQKDSIYYQELEYYGNTLDFSPHTTQKGFPIEKIEYAYENGIEKLMRVESYSYKTTSHGVYDYVYSNTYSPGFGYEWLTMGGLFRTRYKLVDSYYLIQKLATDYYNTGGQSTIESYTYDSHDMVSSYRITGNKPMTTFYTYPQLSDTTTVGSLARRNMMTTIVECITKSGNESQYDVSGYKIDYGIFNEKVLPTSIYRLNTQFYMSSFEEDKKILSYTPNANPIEVVDRSGMHTVYLWAYNGRYMIAEIKNANREQVESVVKMIWGVPIDHLEKVYDVPKAKLEELRKSAILSHALISTWTYFPLIGITSHTDPAGISTHFAYDGLGRLIEEYRYAGNSTSESSKQVLKQYFYNTANK
jgi:YD repeat-containing protein